MFKKVVFLFMIYFLMQLLGSCLYCDDPKSYNIRYNDLILKAVNTSGFQNLTVNENDTVFKNAFGLSINMSYEIEQIIQLSYLQKFSFVNYVNAIAPCPEDIYYYGDPVRNIQIFAAESDSDRYFQFTDKFGAINGNGEVFSIEEVMEGISEDQSNFQFQLINFDTIPEQLIFNVKVALVSGIEFEAKTPLIHFYPN